MKKKILGFLVCAFMILSLTGCGKEEEKTLTCKQNIAQSGISIDMSNIGVFEGSNLKEYRLEYVYDYTDFFKQTGVEITDEIAEQMKESVKTQLETQLKSQKGLTVGEIKNDGNVFSGTITADYETLKKEYPNEFKKDGEFTYEGFKNKNTENGLTCEES